MMFSEHKYLWIGLATLAFLIGALIWMIASSEPFQLLVLFDEVGDLKRGDPVVWKTFTVGKVEKIRPLVDNQVGVTIRLKEEYITSISHGTEFTLKRASFLGLIGENAIELVTPSTPGASFKNGEKVQGKSRSGPSVLESGKKRTLEYWRQLSDRTSALLEEFRTSPFRKDAEEALDQLKDIAEQGARQAKDGLDQFKKDHQKDLDAVLRKLEHLRDQMRQKGDEPGARRVEEEIGRVRRGDSEK